MKNYVKNLGKIIWNGIYSVVEGMSSINLYPKTNFKIQSEKEARKQDYEAIKSDWKTTLNNCGTKINNLESHI